MRFEGRPATPKRRPNQPVASWLDLDLAAGEPVVVLETRGQVVCVGLSKASSSGSSQFDLKILGEGQRGPPR